MTDLYLPVEWVLNEFREWFNWGQCRTSDKSLIIIQTENPILSYTDGKTPSIHPSSSCSDLVIGILRLINVSTQWHGLEDLRPCRWSMCLHGLPFISLVESSRGLPFIFRSFSFAKWCFSTDIVLLLLNIRHLLIYIESKQSEEYIACLLQRTYYTKHFRFMRILLWYYPIIPHAIQEESQKVKPLIVTELLKS